MYPYDKPRSKYSDVGRERYGFAKTLVCAYSDIYGKYTCRYLLLLLFIGFDLENVGLVSMEMVTELGLVVERTSIRRNQSAHF